MRVRLFAALAVTLMCFTSFAVIVDNSEDSEASYTRTDLIIPLIKDQTYSEDISTQFDLFLTPNGPQFSITRVVGDLPPGMYITSSTLDLKRSYRLEGTPINAGTWTAQYNVLFGTEVVGVYLLHIQVRTDYIYALRFFNIDESYPQVSVRSSQIEGSIPLTIPSDVPTKDGFTFLGWGDSPTATTATYHPGDTFDMPLGIDFRGTWLNQQLPLIGYKLYAVWEEEPLNVSDCSVICGTTLSITPDTSGTITVSGADWLTVVEDVVFGTAPDVPGEWTVTVSDGTRSGTFTVTSVPALTFVSVPNPMAFAFEV